jgi:hypothetical protein
MTHLWIKHYCRDGISFKQHFDMEAPEYKEKLQATDLYN